MYNSENMDIKNLRSRIMVNYICLKRNRNRTEKDHKTSTHVIRYVSKVQPTV